MTSWHSYPSIYNLGHMAVRDLLKDPVLVEEKVDGCVTPDTLVLTADLRYVPAGVLCVGDQLIGFEDTVNNPHLVLSTVTAAQPIRKDCFELTTDTRQVTASADHPWLVSHLSRYSSNSHNGKRWVRQESLTEGDEILALPVWDTPLTWEAGYLAGFYDGEGSLVRHKGQRILSSYQTIGAVLETVHALLLTQGFRVARYERRRQEQWKMIGTLIVRGGWTEIIRFLGTNRPIRLLGKSQSAWIDAPLNCVPREVVKEVRHVGDREVIGLSTSSGTYIANGLLCHNSQFSFGIFEGELKVRSKGKEMQVDAPEKMFSLGVEAVKELEPKLREGWTYRGEFLQKPKHNVLAYDRVPKKHIILYDVGIGEEEWLPTLDKRIEAHRLGLESVPVMVEGMVSSADEIKGFLEKVSILGGQKVEGVVIKNYSRFGPDHKTLMGKFVSEAFKEIHQGEWRKANPTQGDIIQKLIDTYKSPARWNKAVQHMEENGVLEKSVKDIGALIKEVQGDVLKECKEEIAATLFKWHWHHIERGIVSGLPQWYKEKLLAEQFSKEGGIKCPNCRSPITPLTCPLRSARMQDNTRASYHPSYCRYCPYCNHHGEHWW